ncbi:UDP-N-acetylmuramoyl-tripeptide--D-alanyl-D-alanine ligase [Lysinibacillus sp. 2017]|uniref:UDP-N-acetylmuramoyl-tripeptide--D-alanyl-D- alanine ligase n=1 Tax=Lysinibacillus sp. 2017 TaxID=2169540 RepID=UPI001F319E4F|nr:UDP-N-acetylmuramoyl-tripeptide--D-alanyl-D-alanine ligase [Lysinibacillus sp. 2017]
MKKGELTIQPIKVATIRQVLRGVLLHGSEDWAVKQVIDYNRHELTAPNTLLFVRRSDTIDWNELQKKAPIVIISDKTELELKPPFPEITVIKVRSALQAYWQFVAYYRNLFELPVVAITGTCGKTTTKEMLKYILSKEMAVQTSVSSKNEPRQSLPYLMGINQQTKAAVFELGLGNTGNIKHQCMIYQPTIGVITNIGVHHLDGCNDLEGYIKAKAEIVDGLKPDGTLIINADDENTKRIQLKAFKGTIVTFGIHKKADLHATEITFTPRGMKFNVHVDNKKYQASIPSFGEHQVYNVLAVLAVIRAMNLSVQKAILRLRTFEQMARHLQFSKGIGGSTIIDDTWTNNPTSIEAALKVLNELGKNKKVIVVLGDINRLGRFERKYHREVGTLVAKQSIHTLVTIGSKAQEIAKQALADGTKAKVHSFQKIEGVLDLLKPQLDSDTLLLIKGPMSSREMIEFAEQLQQNTNKRRTR